MKTILTEPTHGEISIDEIESAMPISNGLFHFRQEQGDDRRPLAIALTGEELTNVAKAWLKHAKEPCNALDVCHLACISETKLEALTHEQLKNAVRDIRNEADSAIRKADAK